LQLSPIQDAWLTAIAEVRGCSRPDVIREALEWVAARETDRVSRTRHYALIGFIAKQEMWNPIDDYLRHQAEHPTVSPPRAVPGVLRASLRPW
jgi:hypothetical protein